MVGGRVLLPGTRREIILDSTKRRKKHSKKLETKTNKKPNDTSNVICFEILGTVETLGDREN